MKIKPTIPYKSKESIDDIANKVLKDYGFNNVIPVDIEKLVETIGFRIVPIFSENNFKGCLFLKTMEIGVKLAFFDENKENIYRFTIAHELAHYIMHNRIYSIFNGSSINEWIDFYFNNTHIITRAEIQADIFASFILMPSLLLNEDVKKYEEMFKSYDNDIKKDRIEYEISKKYKVSKKTAQIRLENLR